MNIENPNIFHESKHEKTAEQHKEWSDRIHFVLNEYLQEPNDKNPDGNSYYDLKIISAVDAKYIRLCLAKGSINLSDIDEGDQKDLLEGYRPEGISDEAIIQEKMKEWMAPVKNRETILNSDFIRQLGAIQIPIKNEYNPNGIAKLSDYNLARLLILGHPDIVRALSLLKPQHVLFQRLLVTKHSLDNEQDTNYQIVEFSKPMTTRPIEQKTMALSQFREWQESLDVNLMEEWLHKYDRNKGPFLSFMYLLSAKGANKKLPLFDFILRTCPNWIQSLTEEDLMAVFLDLSEESAGNILEKIRNNGFKDKLLTKNRKEICGILNIPYREEGDQ
ncbi:MAG: hypothetical protein G01um101418_759 [Parcubacteria group bacterium Gr01-1014_18]|nr:MAG: hypothetical protein Greene041636_771 [Parcubacteria group bacterium Greene0416_36]TSC80124.1 MAG: hypothetical protein G01um101418_759 [Parcubacteria group bacterium Gr01-1014_18]TSC99338.1 MAG: hypothetical protein Greene101420_266 [Parcubacteria group bacterium Greene1014_20]TSD06825.1 MAG: hypothetical protein Greene07142_559 [Parcubacteria group bacterium Greene0714_2]